VRAHDHDQPGPADPARPEQVIAAAAAACSNWGRWGDGDVRGEMWDTETLAADCAADGRPEFWLTAAPLPVTGAVGSPVSPIAVK
jgi:hypothetical protein